MPPIGIAVLRALGSNLLFCLACGPALSDQSTDRADMNACIQKHFTSSDMATVRNLFMVMMATSNSGDDEIQAAVQSKRDRILTDAAQLITRLAETDCKSEIHAAVVSGPKGSGFGILFQQLIAQTQPSIVHSGAVVGIDLGKELDSNVLLDLGGEPQAGSATAGTAPANGASAAGAPAANSAAAPAGPQRISRSTVSGAKLQITFETALNPDCSTIGTTVIRLLSTPAHGKAIIEEGNGFTNFPSTNQRYACNEKHRPGVFLYYQSESKYAGPDLLSYQVIFPNGIQRQTTVDINVN